VVWRKRRYENVSNPTFLSLEKYVVSVVMQKELTD
jgi:hypothetical protein